MAIKRKAVVKAPTGFARQLKKASKKEEPEVEEEDLEEEVADEEEVQDAEIAKEEEEQEEEEEEEEQESEEDRTAREEQEATVSRKKELKGMYLDDLKAVATKAGLDMTKKETMIEEILKHEAQQRADLRARKALVREVLISKKEELEALTLPELRQACISQGITGQLTKQARIEVLIKQWQDDDGVDKALAKKAYEKRASDLTAMDKPMLNGLCEAAGIDPVVKELVVERIVRIEHKLGRFERPSSEMKKLPEENAQKAPKKADIVDALLANEENRKREKELRKQEEDLAESKKRELRAMTMDELKKQLTKHKLDASGKKEELVEALFLVRAQEDGVLARKAELKSLGAEKLKALLELNEIDFVKGTKADGMVELYLAHEEKIREAAHAYEAKVADSFVKQKEDLETKSTAELKEMCASRNLKPGVGKEAHVERLLENLKESGLVETEKLIALQARNSRYSELMLTESTVLLQLASSMEVDILVKEVMVERVMAHEEEHGPIVTASGPPKKKARKA